MLRHLTVCAGLVFLLSPRADAQTARADTDGALAQIIVIGTTPVPGSTLNIDKIPGSIQVLNASELRRNGASSVVDALDTRVGAVNINDTLADPFQPDILFRGFEASPVLGTPQGMAVYQNGVRVNEAFGDTVNWDLIPDIAVDQLSILSATSIYGLNALGGAMTVTMKNGFTHAGFDASFSGGTFNQHQGEMEYGVNNGVLGAYAAIRVLNQGGWRTFAHDALHQYYLDLSLHDAPLTIDLSYSRDDNRLAGQGAAPVQSLALNPKNIFTNPQNNIDSVDLVTLNSAYSFTPTVAMQTVLYFRNYRQSVANGDGSDYIGCTDESLAGLLCQSDGTTPLNDIAGASIPDLTHDGTTAIGQNDFERIHSQTRGGSLQFTSSDKLGRFINAFAAGVTIDTSVTRFYAGTELGLLDAALTVSPSQYFVAQPEGTGFSATPVSLNAGTRYYGYFLTDTIDLAPAVSLTVAGRYNVANVDLTDQLGTSLNGANRFTHFNPSTGLTYTVSPGLTVFGGYSINNRAPTASEIECSNPAAPCLLPSSLASDPPNLRQVVAHSAELGLRGHAVDGSMGTLDWNASAYRAILENDIYGIATSSSAGFFQNVGSTRRQGIDAGASFHAKHWTAYGQYGLVQATFRSALTLNSHANPMQDEEGNIHVSRGDYLPLIPKSRLKLGADVTVLPRWSVGGSVSYQSAQFYRGDESNQNDVLPGYALVSLRTSYQLAEHAELFATVQNLFDKRYANFGLFGDPTGVGAPGVPADGDGPLGDGVNPRFQSPGMPRAFFGGVRFSF